MLLQQAWCWQLLLLHLPGHQQACSCNRISMQLTCIDHYIKIDHMKAPV
jgi:hypothetical protein